MQVQTVVQTVFNGFDLEDIQSMFSSSDVTSPPQLEQAYRVMEEVMKAGKLLDLKYVVTCFKVAGLMIRPTHMIKNGKSWVGAWIWEGQGGAACCITCGFEVRMTKPKEAVPVYEWLAGNGFNPVMELRVTTEGLPVFVMGYKVEGRRMPCKLTRLVDGMHPRAQPYLTFDNKVLIGSK